MICVFFSLLIVAPVNLDYNSQRCNSNLYYMSTTWPSFSSWMTPISVCNMKFIFIVELRIHIWCRLVWDCQEREAVYICHREGNSINYHFFNATPNKKKKKPSNLCYNNKILRICLYFFILIERHIFLLYNLFYNTYSQWYDNHYTDNQFFAFSILIKIVSNCLCKKLFFLLIMVRNKIKYNSVVRTHYLLW